MRYNFTDSYEGPYATHEPSTYISSQPFQYEASSEESQYSPELREPMRKHEARHAHIPYSTVEDDTAFSMTTYETAQSEIEPPQSQFVQSRPMQPSRPMQQSRPYGRSPRQMHPYERSRHVRQPVCARRHGYVNYDTTTPLTTVPLTTYSTLLTPTPLTRPVATRRMPGQSPDNPDRDLTTFATTSYADPGISLRLMQEGP
jgi:hypothetical protein